MGSDANETLFAEDIWWQFEEPVRKFRFKLLGKVEFYSSDAAGAIPLSEAKRLYQSLDDTPFASLYSCVNWSEDLAEAITMRHLSEELRLSYKISVLNDGEEIFRSQPLEKALFKERFLPLEKFYQ